MKGPDYRPGEIVLLSFPFADQEGTKRRPALVMLDTGDQDAVVGRITSQPARDVFDIELSRWREAGLLLPSVVRIHKIATVEKRLVERRLGAVDPTDWPRVRQAITQLWETIG